MSQLKTYLYLTMTAVIWGGTFVAGRNLAPLIDPYTAALLRFLMASSLLLAWLYWTFGKFPSVTRKQLLALLLLGFSGVAAYNLLFFSGLRSVEAGRAALIIAANPVLIALASRWLFQERLGLISSIGVGLSVLGALIVIARGDMLGLVSDGLGKGELMLLGCVLSWVVYTLIGKRVLHGMTPLTAVSYSSVIGTLFLAVVFLARGGVDPKVLLDARVWMNITYLAMFGTVLAFVWFYKGLHAIGAARAAQFINFVPVSGVGFGALLLAEPLTWSLLTGGTLVLTGLWLTNHGKHRYRIFNSTAGSR